MSYDNARQLLLRQGWAPRQDVNDGVLSGNGRIFWERGYTELVASSGTGLAPCRFEFADDSGRILVVETEGEEIGVSHAKVVRAFIEQQVREEIHADLEERKRLNGFTTLADLERRMRLNGFPDLVELRRVVAELAQAAKNGDKSALVNALYYPFKTYENGEAVKVYETPAAALQSYSVLFTADVIDTLRNGHYEALFIRADAGADIGGGRVWLFPFSEGVRIKTIQPWTPEK